MDHGHAEKYAGFGTVEETDFREKEASVSSRVRQQSVVDVLLDERYEITKRGLKSRHAQMIALGGTIGTSLFIGSGQVLAKGGPAFILAGYSLMTCLVFFVVTAITEVATYLPVHGENKSYYSFRYVSPSLGFALGYLYWYALGNKRWENLRHAHLQALPFDAASITSKFPAHTPLAQYSSTTRLSR